MQHAAHQPKLCLGNILGMKQMTALYAVALIERWSLQQLAELIMFRFLKEKEPSLPAVVCIADITQSLPDG